MDEELSRDRILELLAEIKDLKIGAKKALSDGVDIVEEDEDGNVLLSRETLESLLSTQRNINIYAFHSSGINNVGDHSSS
ncbi:hypothetical protein [Agrobacterium fabrum]|uniref:Uncharacterized protein n=1 Tax=Agrobacterium fabrum TaxID=1176649 RepID=A0A7Z7BQ45_9HYPH|nr:hypothetical protein [Agrobacterium fabrum]MCR6727078.1 hypothetical protein [Agrobacterium fabrum]SDK02960.1 hypothetical protein SAMN05428983_3678 [Agrobacterium fabrum]